MNRIHIHPNNSHRNSGTSRRLHWCAGAAALILGAIMSGPVSLSAQIWDPQPLTLLPGSASGVTCDSSNAVYVSGSLKEQQGTGHSWRAAVLKSSDLGETWTATFPNPALPGPHSYASAITCAKVQLDASSYQDQLFVAGTSTVSTASATVRGWELYRSTDAGETWPAITSAPITFNYPAQVLKAVAADSHGNVYVAGYAEEQVATKKSTVTYRHWLVLKGTRQQDENGDHYTWSLVSDIRGAADTPTWAFGATCIGNDVFVAGALDNVWQVRKSDDGGATWTVIDQFELEPGKGGLAYGITSDPAGNLFVVGRASRTLKRSSEMRWVVRKGTKHANSFSSIDPGVIQMQAQDVTVDPTGTVHAVGALGAGVSWAARQGRELNGAWTWGTADQFGTNSSAVVTAVTCDDRGNVFAVGYEQAPHVGSLNWLVKRRLVASPNP